MAQLIENPVNITAVKAYRSHLYSDLFVFRLVSSDPNLLELLDEVDRLLEGSVDSKEAAYNLLLEYENEACCHHNKYVYIRIKMRIFGPSNRLMEEVT
jgi:hypothetical protein